MPGHGSHGSTQTNTSLTRRRVLWAGLAAGLTLSGALVTACGSPTARPAASSAGTPPAAASAGTPAAAGTPGVGGTPTANGTPVATSAVAPAGPGATGRPAVTIKYLQFTLAQDEAQWWAGGIERFRQRRPDILVEHTPLRWDQYWERVALYAAANQMPDTLMLTTLHTPQYARLGAIQSLGPYTRLDRALHLDDQWPAVRRAVTVEGKGPYLLLYEIVPQGVFINKRLFHQAGLIDPTARLPEYWTFDEFRQAAVTLSGRGDDGFQYGLGSPLLLWLAGDALMRSHGGGFANDDNTRTLLDQPASIQPMEQLVELFTKPNITPPVSAGQTGRLWESGRIAMEVGGLDRAFRFRDRVRFEWDVAPLPVATRTRVKANTAQGIGLAMGYGSLQIESAWAFISEMLSAENLAEMVGKPARGVPGRPSARASLLTSDRSPRHLGVFVEGAEVGTILGVSDFDQFQQIVTPAAEAMYTGARPVAEVMRDLAPQVDALLRF
jgi:multiple sugar transport system substrate-binding protein